MNYFEYHRAVEKESKEHRANPQTREPTLSISEAAEEFGISIQALRRRLETADLACFRPQSLRWPTRRKFYPASVIREWWKTQPPPKNPV